MRYIEVRINDSLKVKEVIEGTLKVVAESKNNLVVQGKPRSVSDFTILDKKKVSRGRYQFNSLVEDVAVSDYTKDKYFRENWGLFVVSIYTTSTSKKVINRKLTNALNKHLKKKQAEYGSYFLFTECKIEI